MSKGNLTTRVEKLVERRGSRSRCTVVFRREGETAEQALARSGATWPVIVAPEPCATSEEWLRRLRDRALAHMGKGPVSQPDLSLCAQPALFQMLRKVTKNWLDV